jgi:hypothetical protein
MECFRSILERPVAQQALRQNYAVLDIRSHPLPSQRHGRSGHRPLMDGGSQQTLPINRWAKLDCTRNWHHSNRTQAMNP